ncbi:MAG TPA: class I SAM-dependent methyltransferase [Aggregatilineales bacterium]|nr:class I SAM-dependent methyltransferase [Aggregatilineales bacterium]
MSQDKRAEIQFFDHFEETYDVFTPASKARIIDMAVSKGHFQRGQIIADLGCGAGVFTKELHERGLQVFGMDISSGLAKLARASMPDVAFLVGDLEFMPVKSNSLDAIMLMGVIHHFPEPVRMAQEIFRILKPGGRFVAFDPNRANPFFYLYRVKASPFYSSVGVTENEEPVNAAIVARTFEKVGFRVETDFLSGLRYRYVESPLARIVLPIYNFVEGILFSPRFLTKHSAFVVTTSVKPG